MSLKTEPNKMFAIRNNYSSMKKHPFALAGAKLNKAAQKEGKEYRFLFVCADGNQLLKITEIVEKKHIMPDIDPHIFSLLQTNEAIHLVAEGELDGKVVICI